MSTPPGDAADYREAPAPTRQVPLHFAAHNFGAHCYNTQRCSVIYNNNDFTSLRNDKPSPPPPREPSVRAPTPSAASHRQEAQTSPPTRPEPAAAIESKHAALTAQQAHQQAMLHAQRQAQHERQPHEERYASPAAPRTVVDATSPPRPAVERHNVAQHAAPNVAAPTLSPPLDPPAMRDFRHAEHPLHARYQMFREALGEQGFHQDRPTLNTVPEVRGYSAEQKDRLAAGFTAQLGADPRYSKEIQHFGKNGDTLLAVERPRELGEPPLMLAVSQAQTLARTPVEHAAAWRARELPAPQAVDIARPDPKNLSPDHPGHPDHPRHAMFENARAALTGEYARWGIQKGAETLDRETMQVAIAARGQRMDDVGAIRLGKGSPNSRIGEHPMLAVYSTPRGPEQPMAIPAIVQSQTLQQAPSVPHAAPQFQMLDQQTTQQVQQMQQLQAQISAQGQQGPVMVGPSMGR